MACSTSQAFTLLWTRSLRNIQLVTCILEFRMENSSWVTLFLGLTMVSVLWLSAVPAVPCQYPWL